MEDEKTKKLDDLALHETTSLSDKESVMRVPDGETPVTIEGEKFEETVDILILRTLFNK